MGGVLVVLAIVLVLAAVVWLVSAPLRHRGRDDPEVERRAVLRAELDAARDAKYREIRDTELDWRTGKLSDADHAALDRALRAEAVAILHQLDQLGDE
jgi:hypothetical protein